MDRLWLIVTALGVVIVTTILNVRWNLSFPVGVFLLFVSYVVLRGVLERRCRRCGRWEVKEYSSAISDPPLPQFYKCEHCGGRCKQESKGPLEDTSDPEYDVLFGPRKG